MIVRIKAVKTGLYKNYCCVVYNESEDEQSVEVESLLPHGIAKSFTKPDISPCFDRHRLSCISKHK